ncbi:MAG: ABC transporter substrate-binding protein [Parasporobacterium sp.]|nr:ABC transporter substrate-binding protein [Parasporobacterium sp.]
MKVFTNQLSRILTMMILILCLLVSLAGAAAASEETAAQEGTVTIVDHADREVTVPVNPTRVVILDILPLPSVLTVFLGSAETILAMQPASMNAAKNGILSELFPEVLDVTTDIMNGDDVNIEALLTLDPQIVYYNAANKAVCEKLENAGLTAVGVSPTKWNYDCITTYDKWIELLSQIYPDASLGAEVSAFSSQIRDLIQERTKDMDETERKKVLFLFQYDENTMITSGSSFFGQWWCDASGALNAANEVEADNSNAAITMEQVYVWDPDVIIITNFTKTQPEDLYTNAIGDDDWSSVKAVANGQVYKMPLGTYRTYTPGVDTPMTLEWMASLLYPELFPEFDLAEDVRAYYKDLYGVELTDEQIEAMYHPSSAAGSWK